MKTQFFNRAEAGEFLAESLSSYANRDDVLVLALPRGGVPVAAEVAKRLNAPLDVFVVSAEELIELQRREKTYRAGLQPLEVEGKTAIVVDDGIATGSTMLAAIAALRQLNAARIIVAVPVVAASTYSEMQRAADDVVAVLVPQDFYAVGLWYQDFSQTTDEEVRDLLAEAACTHTVEA